MALRRPDFLPSSPRHRQRKRQSPTKPLSLSRRLPSRFIHPDQLHNRPVLATLNLRRLPSRTHRLPLQKTDPMVSLPITTGSKRKRTTTNENAHTGGRPARGAGRLKRLRSTSGHSERYSSDDTSSSMQVDDTSTKWIDSDESELEHDQEQQEDDALSQLEDHASDDDYLLQRAPASRLRRLLKPELVRLYHLANLTDDPEALTKSDLVDLIIDARDGVAELPPSSPNRAGSSECSSADERLDAEDDEDALPGASSLRRRATFNGLPNGKAFGTRSRSFGSMKNFSFEFRRSTKLDSRKSATSSGGSSRRGRAASRGSQSDQLHAPTPSPPATRLRTSQSSSSSIPGSSNRKGKNKAKRVEFDQHPHIASINDGGPENGDASGEESELTDLEVLERSMKATEPSPRRLRSKDKTNGPTSSVKIKPMSVESTNSNRRVVPKRKVKSKIGSLKEEDTEEEEEEEEVEVDELTEDDDPEEDNVDELDSIPSTSAANDTPRPRRTQRQPRRPVSTSTSSDGDDEHSDADDAQEEEEEVEEQVEAEEAEEEEEDEEDVTETLPRILRNGKVVGEESEAEEMEVDDIPDDETITEGSVEGDGDEGSPEGSDIEAETEDVEAGQDDEVREDDIDLTAATAKTLVRLRRDDLLRLCEERELETTGTKPQLAAALLQWRDNHSGDFSSPSSAGTVRAPTTIRGRRRTRSAQETPATPILDRSHRVHQDEPLTPQVSDGQKEAEAEVELDLETLGLEGREIPPDQLIKTEKIGSGGFKDVYVGKWRRRKVAIAEFRGQLTAMDIKELKLLSSFKHENIVKFLGVSIPENTKETPVMIVSELCSNGDLFDYIRNENTMPTLRKMIDIMLDIAHGLNYLHNCDPSVIHRDCKSSNILITSKGTAKIADFGLAKVKESTRSLAGSLVGTVNWQAPELWTAHPQYDHKVDVFSCAMVYWEMMQWHLPEKQFPWEGMNEHAIYEVVKGKKDNRPPIDGLAKQWSPGLVDLMKWMWEHLPSNRPTMAQVIDRLEELR